MSIAVQGAVGAIGSKATTQLSYVFKSMINTGNFQYGLNQDGIYLLNQGEKDGEGTFERSFTLATSTLGAKNPKTLRSVHLEFVADSSFTLSVKMDDQAWRHYTVEPKKKGLQRVKVPIGRNGQGAYLTFKVSSRKSFRINMMAGILQIRSTGITGY